MGCKVDGCGNAHFGRGWCQKHYARWRKHGSPDVVKIGAPQRFIEEVVVPYTGDDCLIWPYQRNNGGYGYTFIEGKMRVVSRYVCGRRHGPPPAATDQAAHICGNSTCVNPSHVRWATPKQNQADRIGHGTATRGRGVFGAKLSERAVLAIRQDNRPNVKIAAEYGVSPSSIYRIKIRDTWGYL